MIRLSSIVESKQNRKESKLLRVLFISDHGQDKKVGFAKRLIQQRKIKPSSAIRTADEKSSDELLNVFEHYINSNKWDLVIISCRGIYESNKNQDAFNIIQNFRIMIKSARELNIPTLFINMPTAKFVELPNVDLTRGDDARIDDWISNNADYTVDISDFFTKKYFDKTGIHFSKLAEQELYRRVLDVIKIVQRIDSDKQADDDIDDIDDNPMLIKGIRGNKIKKIQLKLVELGYDIDSDELQQSIVGNSTISAFAEFKSDNDLQSNNILDKQTLNLLQSSLPVKKSESQIIFPSYVNEPDEQDIEMYKQILKGISAPVTANTLTFLFAWRDFEAGTAAFNPFNTMQPYGDSTKYNKPGVKNYTSESDGVTATVITLKNGYYNNLLRSLRADETPIEIASNIADLSKWGSKDGPLRVLQSKRVNPEPISRSTTKTADGEKKNDDDKSKNKIPSPRDILKMFEQRERKRRILNWIKENK
jgi:hypothetical protein